MIANMDATEQPLDLTVKQPSIPGDSGKKTYQFTSLGRSCVIGCSEFVGTYHRAGKRSHESGSSNVVEKTKTLTPLESTLTSGLPNDYAHKKLRLASTKPFGTCDFKEVAFNGSPPVVSGLEGRLARSRDFNTCVQIPKSHRHTSEHPPLTIPRVPQTVNYGARDNTGHTDVNSSHVQAESRINQGEPFHEQSIVSFGTAQTMARDGSYGDLMVGARHPLASGISSEVTVHSETESPVNADALGASSWAIGQSYHSSVVNHRSEETMHSLMERIIAHSFLDSYTAEPKYDSVINNILFPSQNVSQSKSIGEFQTEKDPHLISEPNSLVDSAVNIDSCDAARVFRGVEPRAEPVVIEPNTESNITNEHNILLHQQYRGCDMRYTDTGH